MEKPSATDRHGNMALLRWGRRLPCAAVLTAFAISLGTACKRAEPSAPPPPEVLVTAAVQKDMPIYSEWVGTTVGYVNAQVMPRVQGYLLKQDYQDGAYVKANQLLFEIDEELVRLQDRKSTRLNSSH